LAAQAKNLHGGSAAYQFDRSLKLLASAILRTCCPVMSAVLTNTRTPSCKCRSLEPSRAH
jgi:hypothetical protein